MTETPILESAMGPLKSTEPRIGVGILAAFLLHQTVYSGGALVTTLLGHHYGWAEIFPATPRGCFWLATWSGSAALFWYRKRPRLIEIGLPFTLILGFWFLSAGAASWHPDTAEESIFSDFAFCMFLACGSIWGLAVVLGITRRVLGEGKQQAVTIRKAASIVVPALRGEDGTPRNTLVRPSTESDSPSGLLRPTASTHQDNPEELLRVGIADEDSQ